MAVTINEICGGRFGVNIVSGYNKKQYDQMGVWPGDEFFSTRYDYSAEYVQILNELWTDGESNFKGEYFEMKNCKLGPLPAEEIEIVCAGASGRGLDFTAQYGDYSFLMPAGARTACARPTRTSSRRPAATGARSGPTSCRW